MYGIFTCVNGFKLWYSKCRNIFQSHGAYGIEVVYFFESPISTSTGPTGQCSKELAEGTCWQLAQFQRTFIYLRQPNHKTKKPELRASCDSYFGKPNDLKENPVMFQNPIQYGLAGWCNMFFLCFP